MTTPVRPQSWRAKRLPWCELCQKISWAFWNKNIFEIKDPISFKCSTQMSTLKYGVKLWFYVLPQRVSEGQNLSEHIILVESVVSSDLQGFPFRPAENEGTGSTAAFPAGSPFVFSSFSARNFCSRSPTTSSFSFASSSDSSPEGLKFSFNKPSPRSPSLDGNISSIILYIIP